jgi:hypothetical protein
MKCAGCSSGLSDRYMIISNNFGGVTATVSLCLFCVDRAVTRPRRQDLEAMIARAGWRQPTLPHFPDEPNSN